MRVRVLVWGRVRVRAAATTLNSLTGLGNSLTITLWPVTSWPVDGVDRVITMLTTTLAKCQPYAY